MFGIVTVGQRIIVHLKLLQTRLRRISALNGYAGCTEDERRDLEKSLSTTDYISSEESGQEPDLSDEENENAGAKFLVRKRILRRSEVLITSSWTGERKRNRNKRSTEGRNHTRGVRVPPVHERNRWTRMTLL